MDQKYFQTSRKEKIKERQDKYNTTRKIFLRKQGLHNTTRKQYDSNLVYILQHENYNTKIQY